jgi:hypothetical protein
MRQRTLYACKAVDTRPSTFKFSNFDRRAPRSNLDMLNLQYARPRHPTLTITAVHACPYEDVLANTQCATKRLARVDPVTNMPNYVRQPLHQCIPWPALASDVRLSLSGHRLCRSCPRTSSPMYHHVLLLRHFHIRTYCRGAGLITPYLPV